MTKNDQCRLDNLLDIANEPPSRGGPALSEWERTFVRNLDAQFRDRTLTTKQQGSSKST